MEVNLTPKYDLSVNETNCCPKFNPEGWDDQELHFQDKLFVKAKTISIFHIPLNIGSVFPKTFEAIEKAQAIQMDQVLVLSYDPSPWRGEHYFSVTKDVPGQEMTKLSGKYLTKVFEGPFREAPKWCKSMDKYVSSKGKTLEKTYFFYTTCPKCYKHYGKNYVVGVAEIK